MLPPPTGQSISSGSFEDSYQASWLRKRYVGCHGYVEHCISGQTIPDQQIATVQPTPAAVHLTPTVVQPKERPAAVRTAQPMDPRKRALTASTRLGYGVAPHTIPRSPLRAVRNQAGEAAADAAKAAVLQLITEREAAVGAMKMLLPRPEGLVARRRATGQLLLEPYQLAQLRTDLAILLAEVRRATIALCQSVHLWKSTLREHFSYFAQIDADELSFFVGGINVLRKLGTDLAFLPAPTACDPLLVDWFGEQVPWILTNWPELSSAVAPSSSSLPAEVRTPFRNLLFAVRRTRDGKPRHHLQLHAAQQDLRAMAAKHGTLCSPADLLLHAAKAPPAPGDSKPSASGRWQYAAFQVLLYGGEIYLPLLQALPDWFAWTTVSEAARLVQRMYRTRVMRRLFSVISERVDKQLKIDQLARAKREFRAAIIVQRFWHDVLMKRAHKNAELEADIEGKRERAATKLEAANRKAFKESLRLRRESALVLIQRQWRAIMLHKCVQQLRQARRRI